MAYVEVILDCSEILYPIITGVIIFFGRWGMRKPSTVAALALTPSTSRALAFPGLDIAASLPRSVVGGGTRDPT